MSAKTAEKYTQVMLGNLWIGIGTQKEGKFSWKGQIVPVSFDGGPI